MHLHLGELCMCPVLNMILYMSQCVSAIAVGISCHHICKRAYEERDW